MPVRTTIIGSEDTLFITFTCFRWLPLIELTNGYDLVYNWFDYLKTKGHLVTGYVIMPNHLHVLIYFPFLSRVSPRDRTQSDLPFPSLAQWTREY